MYHPVSPSLLSPSPLPKPSTSPSNLSGSGERFPKNWQIHGASAHVPYLDVVEEAERMSLLRCDSAATMVNRHSGVPLSPPLSPSSSSFITPNKWLHLKRNHPMPPP
ncbi:hypothetical protein PIB30_008002 [Stylosanthes scabra]|uniref:Uncharacterized protein n=1 Tax=Stylosanthes scabra TaxID=79078 RepID=A0ABU6U3U3_9FABA|nr:hypothetical protein [Stylosanthes scabra]